MVKDKAEADVEPDPQTTAPDTDDDYVGRVGPDEPDDEQESGAERRADED
jgi:hypothetical protein